MSEHNGSVKAKKPTEPTINYKQLYEQTLALIKKSRRESKEREAQLAELLVQAQHFARKLQEFEERMTRPQRDAASVLGLSWPCTKAEVEAAYRRQAREYHPNRGGSRERFEAIGLARECLLARLQT
jgi:DnaJ domain